MFDDGLPVHVRFRGGLVARTEVRKRAGAFEHGAGERRAFAVRAMACIASVVENSAPVGDARTAMILQLLADEPRRTGGQHKTERDDKSPCACALSQRHFPST